MKSNTRAIPGAAAKGEKAGAEFVAKSRFGPYFLWPQDFQPS
jgi:hypothetical protein